MQRRFALLLPVVARALDGVSGASGTVGIALLRTTLAAILPFMDNQPARRNGGCHVCIRVC
jgi:hypothetical protein